MGWEIGEIKGYGMGNIRVCDLCISLYITGIEHGSYSIEYMGLYPYLVGSMPTFSVLFSPWLHISSPHGYTPKVFPGMGQGIQG
jgi:hypothetical protein